MALQSLIKSSDFLTTNDDDRSSFMRALDKVNVENKEEVEAGFSTLIQKLKESRIPGDMDQGVYMGGHCIKGLVRWAEDFNFDANHCFVDILRVCYEKKPSPGQVVLAKKVWSDSKVDKHIQTLEGPDLADFIAIFRTDYNYQNSKDDSMEKRYYGTLSSINTNMIKKLCSGDNLQQAQTANEAFSEAIVHNLQQAQLVESRNAALVHTNLAKVFLNKFDRNRDTNAIYLTIPHLVKNHLDAAKALVLDPDFPKHDGTINYYKDWLKALSVPLVEIPKEVTGEAQEFVTLMFNLSLSKHEPIRELALVIGRKFKDAKKTVIKSVKIDCELLKKTGMSKDKQTKEVVELYLKYFITPALKQQDLVPGVLATFADFIIAVPDDNMIERIEKTLRDSKTKEIFKNNVDGIKKMMEAILTVCRGLPYKKPVVTSADDSSSDDDSDSDKEDVSDSVDVYRRFRTLKDCFEFMMENMKSAKILTQLNEYGLDVIIEAIKSDNHYLWTLGYLFTDGANWTDKPEKFTLFLEGVVQCAETKMMHTKHGTELFATIVGPLYAGMNTIRDEGLPLSSYIPAYIKLAKTVENREFANDDDMLTTDGNLLLAVLLFMAADGHDISQLGYLIEIPFKYFDNPVDHIRSPAEMLMFKFSQQPHSMLPHMNTIMDMTLKNKNNVNLITLFKAMVPLNWSLIHERLDDILECSVSTAITVQMLWLDVVRQIAEDDTKGFNAGHIDRLKTCISQKYVGLTVFGILHIIAKSRPELLRKNQSWMVETCKSNPDTISFVMMIIPLLSNGKGDYLKATVDELMELLSTFRPSEKVFVLACIRSLAIEDKSVVQPHVNAYESLKSNRECAEVAQQLIDIAKGRTAKELGIEIADQRVTLGKVEKDVDKNKMDVGKISANVGKQDAKLSQVTEDVKKTKENVSDLKSDVVELGAKVEEVDHKTMTNAPDWSRDVSLLLNKPSDADWRLLAQRLGYSNNDIRAWACQADPCMAVLSEWYANHKAREATFGVMKALEEMHCEEALKIVKEAAQKADNVVTDDSGVEITNPPPVFLSYQWGHQEEAKMLKEHLEAAGFRCWMDLGQMGGGDKLFAKIDAGMRSAAVVICCVTHKYAKSDNCNREVNLAVTVGKPIIPLLVEKMSWPPEGAMGPIFGEYLFIRFFARPKETISPPEVFWPQAKLKELLFQLRCHIIPEENLITKEYESWWLPPGQKPKAKIVSKPAASDSSPKTNTLATQDTKEAQALSPFGSLQIFISYQWGRQSEVEMFYNKLTRLGYSCWMDIHQMGGGDSLYDKIDRGIRGCCVVVSCVTPKYAMSANCRKEITLAEALKKPIIPLMLDTVTWPPEGPMSMVLAQLAYIDCRAEVSEWNGQAFQSLLKQISKHMKPARTLGFPDLDKVDESPKPFDPKRQWRKVKNVSTVVSTSQACHIL